MASLESPPPPACSRYVDLPDPGSPTSTTMRIRIRIASRAEQPSAPGSSLRFSCRPFTVTLVWMPAPLTPNQIRGFWAAWGGWALDGMDSFIYALVLVPALRELLPRSGIAATQANIGFYGSVLFAIFLTGWGWAVFLGAARRSFRPGPHPDPHHPLLLALHVPGMRGRDCLAARPIPFSRGRRHRGRMRSEEH